MLREGWVRGGMASTGAAHFALPQTFSRHHADPGQSGGFPGERGSCCGWNYFRPFHTVSLQDPLSFIPFEPTAPGISPGSGA